MPAEVIVRLTETYTLKVYHIYSALTIGNTLNIKLRLETPQPWVSFSCQATYCDVIINGSVYFNAGGTERAIEIKI